MSTFTETIDVHVPLRQAYDQWTQFESFPRFMAQVDSVEQIDDETLRWTVRAAGVQRDFLADIKTQTPDQEIAWQAQGDVQHSGRVTFKQVDPTTTKVQLEMHVEPTDWVEKAADAMNLYEGMVKRDLRNFKEFIEERGVAEDGWRGTIDEGRTTIDDTRGDTLGSGADLSSGETIDLTDPASTRLT